jgi:uncharacterized protein (TIGR02001 family)
MRWAFETVKRWRPGTSVLAAAVLAVALAGGAGAQTTGPATGAGSVPAGNVAEQAAAPTAGIPLPGGFTLTGLGAVASDYLFRGISQTRNNWAFQGTFDLEHESGVYVGAFLTNAKFLANPYNDTRQELDLLAGYRFAVAGVKFDVGYIAYLYPGQDKAPGGQLNEYQEVGLKASYTIDPVKLQAAFFYSPNFFGRSGDGFYVEGGVDVTLPLGFTAIGRIAHQWIERNPFFGTPDYLWYAVGIQREIFAGITLAVGLYGTDISKRDCAPVVDRANGGQRICGQRALFTVSRAF